MIINGLSGRSLPVYGGGQNIRDWLYVDDHAEALRAILKKGRIGESWRSARWKCGYVDVNEPCTTRDVYTGDESIGG